MLQNKPKLRVLWAVSFCCRLLGAVPLVQHFKEAAHVLKDLARILLMERAPRSWLPEGHRVF